MFAQATWDYFHKPEHRGALPDFTGEGWAGSRRYGLYVRIQLRLREQRVEEARFETVGCLASIACCEALLAWATGKTLEEVRARQAAELDAQLGGLPPVRLHCAEMAIYALNKALDQEAQTWNPPHDSPPSVT